MLDERINELIKREPYLKRYLDNGIVVISPNSEKYIFDKVQFLFEHGINISRQLILDLLTYDDSYGFIKGIFDGSRLFFNVTLLGENGNYKTAYAFSKNILIRLFNKIQPIEDPEALKHYNELKEMFSYENFKSSVINNTYDILIDGINYHIKIRDIFEFMDIENYDIVGLKEFKNIPIAHFIYAANMFYKENGIFEKYDIDEKYRLKLYDLTSSMIIDVEAVNEYTETRDALLSKIAVDSELEREILRGLPQDYNELEKAIYVYIKMCKLLSYDEQVYVSDQEGDISYSHRNVNRVSSITLTNNKVVCYEFNAIYAYMLNKLGINYKCFKKNEFRNGRVSNDLIKDTLYDYGKGHIFLKFRSGKFIVQADSTTSILQGDMICAKLNQELKGLACVNENSNSRFEFNHVLSKVYEYIASREKKITENEVGRMETFDEVVSKFSSLTDKKKPISINDKIEILINKVNSTDLAGVDAYAYLLQLRKILFTLEEQQKNIAITIIRDSRNNDLAALAIITIVLQDENGKSIINRYMYKPSEGLTFVTLEDLQGLFDDDSLGYINEKSPTIDGIKR